MRLADVNAQDYVTQAKTVNHNSTDATIQLHKFVPGKIVERAVGVCLPICVTPRRT